MYIDILLSATDQNIDQAMTVHVTPSIELKEGSKAISVSIKFYISWISVPFPYRKRDEQFSRSNLERRNAIVIKGNGVDVRNVPQPIPIDNLSWDPDFKFPRNQERHKVGTSTSVEYTTKTKDEYRVVFKRTIKLNFWCL